jgi:hypothetical protein
VHVKARGVGFEPTRPFDHRLSRPAPYQAWGTPPASRLSLYFITIATFLLFIVIQRLRNRKQRQVLSVYVSTILFILSAKNELKGDNQVTVPSLSDMVKRTCNALRQGATMQISDYEQRFSTLKNLYDDLLANLIKQGFSSKEAWETATEFFGSPSVRFAGIDGTMYTRPLFDMVIFFGGACASTGTITFEENSAPKIGYDQKTIPQNMGISSVVPIYINEIPDVDHTFAAQEQPDEVNPAKAATNEGIANNSLIANAIMAFSEYYLALKLATDPARETRVILMDRSLSTERASLLYETRKTGFWHAKTALIGYQTQNDTQAVDAIDLTLARQHVINVPLGLPPPRADLLRTALFCLLETKGRLTFAEIASELEMKDEKRTRRVQTALAYMVNRQILTEQDGACTLNPQYVESWSRIKRLTLELGDQLFFTKTVSTEVSSSMKIVKAGKEHWLTTLDIAFLTLFALHMLMEECWKKHILLVGITKDTSAHDFKRQLVPIMMQEGLLKTTLNAEALRRLPNTDRMILQSASIFNTDKVSPPWSLVEYDSAFRTMQPTGVKGWVSGAIRNKISLEKAFLKAYVQLSQAKSDPMLRSNVLLIDRLVYPEFDCKPESTVPFLNALSDGTKEPVDVLLFRDRSLPNSLQNLTLTMLIAMAPVNIPEAFGHNKPLFIADKIAKWNYSQFKSVVDTTAAWILNNHKLRKFIFYMSTFRERRSQIEQNRRARV